MLFNPLQFSDNINEAPITFYVKWVPYPRVNFHIDKMSVFSKKYF
jgi:hypothetical protein